MKKALVFVLVAVFGTAVMFGQEAKKETKPTTEKKEVKAAAPASKESAKPVDKKNEPAGHAKKKTEPAKATAKKTEPVKN